MADEGSGQGDNEVDSAIYEGIEMKLITAPSALNSENKYWIFLAGSIEMGKAVNWQQHLIVELKDEDITILNPRRDDWDSSWIQSIENDNFREQVEWELQALEMSDIIALYFAPNTKSPISLLEFGLHARLGKLIVCCPEGFWRKGNVDIVCRKYGVEQAKDIDDLINKIKRRLRY